MMSLTPILILAAAQAAAPPAAAGPPADPPKSEAAGPNEPCTTPLPRDGEQEIVICVERPEGYRLNPDLMEAEREARRKKLKRPERFVDNSCASVGPMGCRNGGGINLLAAAVTAATMAKRALTGEGVGEMFITEPQPDEFQLYQQAKREREAKRAAEAEALKEKVAEAEASRAE
jgi:hypothetical protein